MTAWEEVDKYLTADNEELRLQGLRELHRFGVEERLSRILTALGDVSWRIRKEAANAFLMLPSAGQLAGQIVELLHSEDNAGLRNVAAEILVKLGRQSLPYLLEELACNDHDVRKFVLDILGEIRDDSTVPAMQRMILDDPDENVRAAAVENLGKLRSVESIPTMLDALNGPSLLLRFTVLEALSHIGSDVPVDRLLSLYEDRLLRKPLFDCLGRIGSGEAVALLLTGLSDPMRNVREAAALALARIAGKQGPGLVSGQQGEGVADALFEMLESTNVEVRRAAIKLLGIIHDPRAAVRLLDLFDDEELRDDAVRALIAAGHAGVCALLELWPAAPPRRKLYLAYLFTEVGCVAALSVLVAALYTPDIQLREVAVRGVGRLGGADEVATIAPFLGDENAAVRRAAVDALEQLGRQCQGTIIKVLHGYLADERPEVRCAAVQILGRLGGREVEPSLMLAMKDESSLVRCSAIRALSGGHQDEQRQALVLALNDEDNEVRRQAVETLAASHDPQNVPALALALGDDDLWVRTAAIRALGLIGGPEALDFVRRGLRDPVGLITIATLETLAECDPQGSLDDLCTALNHPDDEVACAALRLLALRDDSSWLRERGGALLDHRYWDIRLTVARLMAERLGAECLSALAARLLIEGEEIVREQLREIVESLAEHRG